MHLRSAQERYFLLNLLCICGFYLGFEFFYNTYAMISVDEFWFAHRIFQYQSGLPYKDFAPYKSVLGYYLLLWPMTSAKGILGTLIFTKNALAILNTIILFGSSCWLTRFFSANSVLCSITILIASEIVLSFSTNIRVDLLGYWFCLFSLLFLLENRFLLAGLLIGLGFATTQKAIWYIFASNCALGFYWLIYERKTATFINIIRFNVSALAVILAYILLWTYLSDWQTVTHNLFYEAKVMYQLDWYNAARKLFWQGIILINPLIFFLWPLTFISLFVTYENDTSLRARALVVPYALAILMCLIPYKQVFPYYMQVTIPVFLVTYSAFFTWLFGIFSARELKINVLGKKSMWMLLGIYIFASIYLIVFFNLPQAYLLFTLIPLLLGTYIVNKPNLNAETIRYFFNLILLTMVFIGGIYPLMLFSFQMVDINGFYQKANIEAINSLLADGSDYVAGIELIYNKDQAIPGMRHLMGPAIDYLISPTPKLRAAMLASLYEDPNATQDTVIAAWKKSDVKLYVNNYRMMEVPKKIKDYMHSQYEHFWGSIYLYAPHIAAGKNTITLKFSGNYLLESTHGKTVTLNGKTYPIHSSVFLAKGIYLSNAAETYRIKLLPNLPLQLNPALQQDHWMKMLD